MPNHEVSYTVVEMVVGIAEREGLSLEALCDGLPMRADALGGMLRSLDWALFTQLLERIERRIGRDRLVEHMAKVRDVSPIGRRLMRHFVSPKMLFRFICHSVGPTMYPMYDSTYAEVENSDGSLTAHVAFRLHAGLRPSHLIFELHAVALAALPAFIDQPPFPVRAQTTDRGGDYWFELRPPRPAAD